MVATAEALAVAMDVAGAEAAAAGAEAMVAATAGAGAERRLLDEDTEMILWTNVGVVDFNNINKKCLPVA